MTTTTCSGTSPSGQQLSYDAQGRLSLWQGAPTQTVNYLYDGSGTRVAMQSTVNGTTTLTSYIGSIEEVQTSGSSTQTTTYYEVGSKRIAADVNGTFYYFGYDALGSQVAVVNAMGSLVGAQLYGPYGTSRYNTGTLPTSIGFTGQRADSVTGLDYYNARYYDPGVGQFLSVDSVQGNAQGMDPYTYVGGNPESRTDPSGNRPTCGDIAAGCSGNSGEGSSSGGSSAGEGSSGGGVTRPTPTRTKPTSRPARPMPGNGSSCGGCKAIGGKHGSRPSGDQITKVSLEASKDSQSFTTWTALFENLTHIAELVGALLGVGTIFGVVTEDPFLASILAYLTATAAGLVWAFNTLASIATKIATDFTVQSGWRDENWSATSIKSFFSQEKAEVASLSSFITNIAGTFWYNSRLRGFGFYTPFVNAAMLAQRGVEAMQNELTIDENNQLNDLR